MAALFGKYILGIYQYIIYIYIIYYIHVYLPQKIKNQEELIIKTMQQSWFGEKNKERINKTAFEKNY